jgi:hypothetical protein
MIKEMASFIMKMVSKLQLQEGVDIDSEAANMTGKMRQLRHEELDGVHYFYYEDDNGFACQGKTLEEAAQHFKASTKGEIMAFFKMSNRDEEYVFIDGDVHHASIKQVSP